MSDLRTGKSSRGNLSHAVRRVGLARWNTSAQNASRRSNSGGASQEGLVALTSLYLALGAIAGATLVTLIGAALVPSQEKLWYYGLALLGLVPGAVGVGCLIFGSICLFQTTKISLSDVRHDANVIREGHLKHCERTNDIMAGGGKRTIGGWIIPECTPDLSITAEAGPFSL
jgi:hypothetical protein